MNRLPAPPSEPTTDKAAPEFKQHVWESGWDSGNTKTCKVCGVTLETGSVFLADKVSLTNHYRDAYGQVIQSLEPLPCPLFIGQTNGAVATTKVKVNRLDKRVGGVEDKVGALEDRLEELARRNAELESEVRTQREIDLTRLVEWMASVAAQAAQASLPTVEVKVAGLPYEVPRPIADLLVGAGRVVVTVDPAREDELEDELEEP